MHYVAIAVLEKEIMQLQSQVDIFNSYARCYPSVKRIAAKMELAEMTRPLTKKIEQLQATLVLLRRNSGMIQENRSPVAYSSIQ